MNRLFVAALLSGCAVAPEGLRETPDGPGPVVVVDWDAEPLPEIPYPNDLATIPDPMSVTGMRLNISEVADTTRESEARQKINELSGFGIFAPITVAFEAPLDLDEIVARHPNDFEKPAAFEDDAFYVINVDPDSPDYLQPVALDVGHGRFPLDVPKSDRYFPNDKRADSPSLMFETYEEDLNGNGVLDPGEDTDDDGVLDHPNVYPLGGDPREDLLTFYERETNTLIVRPVVPLREETTYAVVLTERLVGEDGNPVRSPWAYVNHTRQTEALAPVLDALPNLGLAVEDVAFTWTFTTGRITGDLVDIRRGLNGEGPWAFLDADYPPGLTEGLQTNDIAGEDPYMLPINAVIDAVVELGLFDGDSAVLLQQNYDAFSSHIVGGAIEVPYLLADRDDGDDSDEWWQADPVRGTLWSQPQRVAFTCVLPKESAEFKAPFPVAMFGHGYGSSRFDLLGFAWAFNQVGFAACAADFPGHGPTLSEEEWSIAKALLSSRGLLPFLQHLEDSRYRDLNNDGVRDSGGDQWSADGFHTRDMVRQAAVDWMAMVDSFKACGTGEMALVDQSDDGPVAAGGSRVTCDWDDDGVPDLGGPDVQYGLVGGSLGGINAAVAAPVIPEITAWAPIVPGGGTLDIGVRTEIGGAVEALVGRLMTPLFLGYPDGSGGLDVVQMVNSVTDMVELHVAHLDSIPAGGRIEVENTRTGKVRAGHIPDDGTFRVGIGADGLDAFEKKELAGLPDAPNGVSYSVPDNEGLGDLLIVRVYDASGSLLTTIDTWEEDVVHEGVTMLGGSPLVAASHGLGKIRGTPELRRLAMVLAGALEPGDAIAYAPHFFLDPFEELGGKATNVLLAPTPGDMIVCINTGIALARAAGLVEWQATDDRYGTTVDQWLIDRQVIRGLEEFGPWTGADGTPVLFDADDFDAGTDDYGAPSDAPLRETRQTSSGVSGLRLPYADPNGSHGFAFPDPALAFDINTFAISQIAWFVATDGQELLDDPCLADGSCDFMRQVEP
jgi:hypothetical protein